MLSIRKVVFLGIFLITYTQPLWPNLLETAINFGLAMNEAFTIQEKRNLIIQELQRHTAAENTKILNWCLHCSLECYAAAEAPLCLKFETEAKLFLEYGANPNGLTCELLYNSDNKRTILMECARKNPAKHLALLLEHGGAPTLFDDSGLSTLHHAIKNKNEKEAEAMLALLAKQMDLDLYTNISSECFFEPTHQTALFDAIKNQKLLLVKKLLQLGANPNNKDLGGRTLLDYMMHQIFIHTGSISEHHPDVRTYLAIAKALYRHGGTTNKCNAGDYLSQKKIDDFTQARANFLEYRQSFPLDHDYLAPRYHAQAQEKRLHKQASPENDARKVALFDQLYDKTLCQTVGEFLPAPLADIISSYHARYAADYTDLQDLCLDDENFFLVGGNAQPEMGDNNKAPQSLRKKQKTVGCGRDCIIQ